MNGLLKLIETLQSLDFEVLDHMLEEDHLLLIKVHNYSAFQLHLQFNEVFSRFSALIVVRTESHMFDGDRSDVTSLLAIIAVIFAKIFFNVKMQLIIQQHPIMEDEIDGFILFLRETKYIEREFDLQSTDDIIGAAMGLYTLEIMIGQHFNFGAESNLPEPVSQEKVNKLIKRMKLDKNHINYSKRINNSYQWIYAPRNGVIHFEFDNKLSFYYKIKKKYSLKSIVGMECALLKIKGFKDVTTAIQLNALSLIEIAAECSNDKSDKIYIPIENCIIALGEKTITAISCDCSSRTLSKEIQLIKQRQSLENQFLFEDRGFKWNEKINDDEFEKMIMELLYYEPGFWGANRVGATREGDGGRDLQVMVSWIEGEKVKTGKIIIQCKAYKKSVGKSDVRDIRDTIEHYGAKGFMVVTSSHITVPLQDHLENLKIQQSYFIEWWNRESIELKLRQQPDILKRYPNIVTPFDISTF